MKRFNITVNGKAYDVQVEEVGGAAAPAAPAAAAAPAEGAETINAPMPGNVLNVMVKAGDKVAKGDVLLILEAMKMENEIMAPHDGTSWVCMWPRARASIPASCSYPCSNDPAAAGDPPDGQARKDG